MSAPKFVSAESEQKLPVLIIDKQGLFASLLVSVLAHEFLPVTVSQKEPTNAEKTSIFIPFLERVPRIPDNNFPYIFLVYDKDKKMRAMLPPLIAKANQTNAVLFVILSYRDADERLLTVLLTKTPSVKIIVYGEMFGNMPLSRSPFGLLLAQAASGQVIIFGNGLQKLYPIHTRDVVSGILACAFADHAKERLFFLLPKHPPTELSVARLLRKIYPLLKIDFGKGKIDDIAPPFHKGTYMLPDPYPLEDRLRLLNLPMPGEKKGEPIQIETKKREAKLPSFKRLLGLSFILTSVLLVPLLFLSGVGFAGGILLSQSVQELEQGNFAKAKQAVGIAKQAFVLGETTTLQLLPAATYLRQERFIENVSDTFHMGIVASDTTQSGIEALSLFENVASGKTQNPKQDFYKALQESKNAIVLLRQLEAEKRIPKPYGQKLQKYEPILALFLSVADALPDLLGFDNEKIYLVLFQNNMELRPGGGFIGSYGLLTVKNGKMLTFTIHDVYDADGKLKGHLEPPFAIKRHLGASHWFLRDSNMSADFPTNAKKAAYFLNLETNERVDGVIGVDVSFAQTLLSVVGPISIPEYQTSVSSENFFTLIETKTEEDFFPGSTQKRDILTAVYKSLEQALFVPEKAPLLKLAIATTVGIEQKHVQFAFSDPYLARIFSINNLSGSIVDERVEKEDVVNDFLLVSETNVGANKANYHIQRAINTMVQVNEEGRVVETVKISYTHTGSEKSAFNGDYKNYLRIFVPKGSVLDQVAIDGKALATVEAVTDPAVYQAKQFRAPEGLEIETAEEEGKRGFGALLVVPSGSRKTITLTYQLAKQIALSQPAFSYDLRFLKQPGTNHDPFTFTLLFPKSFRPIDVPSYLQKEGDSTLTFSNVLTTDKNVHVEFAKQ
ncbi:MAG: DUF4012 domain-containing protein [Candidatus Levybacteria bacterium]|nr:DUF4012 domain-containing protein [Candidatus Levybacteria bacterium]